MAKGQMWLWGSKTLGAPELQSLSGPPAAETGGWSWKWGKIKWFAGDHTAGKWQPGTNAGLSVLTHCKLLTSHNPSSKWPSWPDSGQTHEQSSEFTQYGNQRPPTPVSRPTEAAEGRLFDFPSITSRPSNYLLATVFPFLSFLLFYHRPPPPLFPAFLPSIILS